MLFNIHTLAWDDELLKLLDVPRAACCRRCGQSSEVYGETDDVFGAADSRSPASPATSRPRSSARRASSRGTGQEHLRHRLLHADEHRRQAASSSHNGCSPRSPGSSAARPMYALEGSVFIGGAVVQWLRDGLGMIKTVRGRRGAGRDRARQRRRLSRAGLRRAGRAALGRRTPAAPSSASRAARRPAHIARAALESIAFQVADLLDAMQRGRRHRRDGAARRRRRGRNDLLMQFQADLLRCPGRAPEGDRDDRAGRRVPGRAGGRLLEGSRRSARAHWQVDRTLRAADERRRSRAPSRAAGRRHWNARAVEWEDHE